MVLNTRENEKGKREREREGGRRERERGERKVREKKRIREKD